MCMQRCAWDRNKDNCNKLLTMATAWQIFPFHVILDLIQVMCTAFCNHIYYHNVLVTEIMTTQIYWTLKLTFGGEVSVCSNSHLNNVLFLSQEYIWNHILLQSCKIGRGNYFCNKHTVIRDVATTCGGGFTSGHKSHDVQPQGILLWISPFSCTPWPKLAENRWNGALLLLFERAITSSYPFISTTLQIPIISVDSNFISGFPLFQTDKIPWLFPDFSSIFSIFPVFF